MPVLRRAGRELPGVDNNLCLRFCRLFIGETIVGYRAFHHAKLAENTRSGVVVRQ